MPAYFDHAATAPLHPAARAALVDALDRLGNPSSIHAHGQRARRALEDARARIGASLGAEAIETVLTSGGTESINLAIKGLWWARNRDAARPRILTTRAEHHSTLDAVAWLVDRQGAQVTWLPVDAVGRVDLAALEQELAGDGGADVALVTLLHANNEIGTVQPVRAVAQLAAAAGVPVHIDAVASYGQLPVSLHDLGVAALSVSAHKVGGPVGVGALAVARGTSPEALLHGGGQQLGFRSGTQDVVGALAFAAVADELVAHAEEAAASQRRARDEVLWLVRHHAPEAELRGDDPDAILDDAGTEVPARLPGNAHFTFPGSQGDSLLFLLDMAGVSASTGSACQAGIPEPSHVLLATGLDEATARGALRFTVGAETTAEELAALDASLPGVVAQARKAGLSNREVRL
ncbi:cysteine desulfurase [Gulosibacter macacae]|uniref:Cysteine desulfurase n=1 Tax=Gulosibacter macacae TaxID=2488791 RepID=A0A3P3VUE1_9MICO|nr:cysteine desulfurase family protein [Gulosibacter macacae]RRJ86074.1 cysteine desulfurase [Gulosibacter macacae]